MNNKLLTAALVGAASASVQRCENDLVTAAEAARDGLQTKLDAANAATAGVTATAQVTATALATAITNRDNHATSIASYLSAYTTADTASTTNTSETAAATAAIATSAAALVGLEAARAAAALAVTNQNALISTQEAEITELGAAVTRHATELGVLQATVTAKLALVTTAQAAIDTETAKKATIDGYATTRALQSTPATGCTCTFKEVTVGATWVWECKDTATGLTDCTAGWKGLTALKDEAVVVWGGTGADITNASQVGAAGSKKKASDDLQTAYVKTTATTGAGENEAIAFAAYETDLLKQAVYLSGCIKNASNWQDVQSAVCKTASGSTPSTADPWDMQFAYQALHTGKEAKKTTMETATTGTTALNTAAQTALAQAKHDTAVALWEAQTWTELVTANGLLSTTSNGLITGSLATAKKTADDAHKTAQLAETVGTTQKTQADTNLARANTLLAALKTGLAPMSATLAVAEWQKAQEEAKKTAQEAIETQKTALAAGLTAVRAAALKARDRAQASQAFYESIVTEAQAARDIDEGLKVANAALIVSLGDQLTAAKANVAAEIAGCKGAAYAAAQKLVKEISDQAILDADAADAVKKAYTLASTAPTTGAAGTRCEKSAEGVRAKCADELCCGAAQKILRDGTKLAVETCQPAVGTHTYEYYPPLPTGATVQPSPETWRFQCISGAQKLVAAATAALAASYMMA